MRLAFQPESGSLPRHVPSLDGLRAIAAIAVVVEHVYQEVPLIKVIIPGYFGVRLFFVLSGYLITGILLAGADANENGHANALFWKNFYIRRALRIFPAYYLCLMVALALATKVHGLQGHHWWRFAYLTNWHMALHNTADVYYGHLWTLAVEEQFYLVWPFVILLVPARFRILASVALITAGPVSRLISGTFAPNEFWIHKPTWSCFDSLGFGALLACLRNTERDTVMTSRFNSSFLRGGLVLLIALGLYARLRSGERAITSLILLGIAEGILFFLLIHSCTANTEGRWKRWLAHPWLVAVGKVSYGVYLYHAFVMPGVSFAFRRLCLEHKHGIGLHIYFLLVTAVSIGVALVSWNFFEAPLNKLKERFPYSPFAAKD